MMLCYREEMAEDAATRVVATQAWFIKANEDLREAEFVLTATPPFIASSLFHSEQAVEKAAKGFLTWHDQVFRTDDLEQLSGKARPRRNAADPSASVKSFRRLPTEHTEYTEEICGDCAISVCSVCSVGKSAIFT